MIAAGSLAAVVVISMLVEARLSRAHDHVLRSAGATEPQDDVYPIMQVAYPGAFLALLGEGAWRHVHADGFFWRAWPYSVAKGLKYWAIATLGSRWTFRVLVPPASSRIVDGPYRWMRHPNYVAVALELAGVAIAMHALVTGVPAVAGFIGLMLARIRVEERALAGRRG